MTPRGVETSWAMPGGEGAHRRQPLCAGELLVAFALHFGEIELPLELELLSLPAKRDGSECEHQAGCDEDAKDESHLRALLAIPLAGRGGDGRHAPST